MLYHLPHSSPLPPLEPRRIYSGPAAAEYGPERPAGVTLLALLNFFTAGLTVLLLVITIASPKYAFDPRLDWVPGFPYALRIIAGAGPIFLGVVGAIISLAVAIGLWSLRQWARVMALVVYIGGVVITLWANYNEAITGSTLMSLAIGVAATIYLLKPEAERAFGELPIHRA